MTDEISARKDVHLEICLRKPVESGKVLEGLVLELKIIYLYTGARDLGAQRAVRVPSRNQAI